MATDWRGWHGFYDDPTRSLYRRLATVRELLDGILLGRLTARTVLVSMCSGDGRDALPVLANGHEDVRAVLVEVDPGLAEAARESAQRFRLPNVEIRIADAGILETYVDIPRADVLLACGVFGNISDRDLDRTIAGLVHLLDDDAVVIWTRSDRSHAYDPSDYHGDPSDLVRHVFARYGYEESTFVGPIDADFRVGVHRRTLLSTPSPVADPVLFNFTR